MARSLRKLRYRPKKDRRDEGSDHKLAPWRRKIARVKKESPWNSRVTRYYTAISEGVTVTVINSPPRIVRGPLKVLRTVAIKIQIDRRWYPLRPRPVFAVPSAKAPRRACTCARPAEGLSGPNILSDEKGTLDSARCAECRGVGEFHACSQCESCVIMACGRQIF